MPARSLPGRLAGSNRASTRKSSAATADTGSNTMGPMHLRAGSASLHRGSVELQSPAVSLRSSVDPRSDPFYPPGRARFGRAERLLRHLPHSLESALLAGTFAGALGPARGAALSHRAFA